MTPLPPGWSSLLPALLDFERTPGRYPVVLREPRPLFEHIGTVMQLAVGRPVEVLPAEPANELELRRAARFFVRTVMLRPGSDHFTLLGLNPGFEPAQLREHYRLMIRLTHPDFAAGSGEAWPADAATRVNLANDVLSSPVKRADYTAALHPPANAAPTAMAGTAPMRPRPARPRPAIARDDERAGWLSNRAKLGLAGTGAVLALGAFLFMSPVGNEGSLAVRRVVPVQDPMLMPSAELAERSPEPAALLLAAASSEAAPLEPPAPVAARPKALALAAPAAAAEKATPVAVAAAPVRSEGYGGASDGLSLMMETRLSEAPPERLAPEPAPAPSELARPAVRLTLAQVQPTLTNLMASLQSGRGESVMQWIGGDWRSLPANGAFVGQFNQLLAGRRVLQVGKVQLRSSQVAEQLVVDGVVQLHLEDANNLRQVKDLQLRAFFQPQDGKPVLTQLVAGGLQ